MRELHSICGCPTCGYDLSSLFHMQRVVCPECGNQTTLSECGKSQRTASSTGTLGLAFLLLLVMPLAISGGDILISLNLLMAAAPGNGVVHLIVGNAILYAVVAIGSMFWADRVVNKRYRSIPQHQRSILLRVIIVLLTVLGIVMLFAGGLVALGSFVFKYVN